VHRLQLEIKAVFLEEMAMEMLERHQATPVSQAQEIQN
jgi:hypothetical protein